ncbi:lytic murein transglycosylase [Lysobacter silvestris]|uniref:Lytic murein transglycosylase n=1 Tax=Solilutibacter silvestris TaxID=1645665 RepID=A0A2K1PY79_9GAMM|nr:lytic murein transglycosylase [Lysobacter silvestris]
MTRPSPRTIPALLASALLAACAQQPVQSASPAPVVAAPTQPAAPAPTPAPQQEAVPAPVQPTPAAVTPLPTNAELMQFNSCMIGLRTPAMAAGVESAAFDRYAMSVTPDMTVLPLLDRQPEFTSAIWDYLAGLVDQKRVDDGRTMMAKYASTLSQVQSRFAVDPATVAAVWGVESDFGRINGRRPLLVSLGTLSCFGRRQAYFRSEFYELLKIAQRGDVAVDDLKGSWAGAFGQTQFMPSTYNRMAVDFDGDGRRDLVRSAPDALASTANYLLKSGWREGQPWGYEVKLPSGFDAGVAGRKNRQPLSRWQALGIKRVDGQTIALDPGTPAAVLLPAGVNGPAFLVFRNFDAIYSYNAAESYALAIALLSDRLRGGSGLRTPWPTDDPGLSRADRVELQRLLLKRGHAIGTPDGVLGTGSRAAIQQEQQRLGMTADGRAGQKLLKALRDGR